MDFERMSVQMAVRTIKEQNEMSNYKLAKLLGLKQQIMIKRYLTGEVKTANVKVAYAMLKQFNILLDNYNTVDELEACYEAV